MIQHHLASSALRVLIIALVAAAASVVLAFNTRHAPRAGADPTAGNVKAMSGVVIEGHIFNLPVQMNTCTDITNVISTATGGSATTLADTTKSWAPNQFANMNVTLTSGTGSVQSRTITSNTSNTLTVSSDWGLTAQSGTASGGTSTALVDAGAGWIDNQFVPNPYNGYTTFTLQLNGPGGPQTRTILSNTSDTLTVSSAWPVSDTGTASGGSSTTVVDATKIWTTDQFANQVLELTSGTDSPNSRVIVSNTSNTLTVASPWPIATGGVAMAATATTLTDYTKSWAVDQFASYSIELTSGTGAPQTLTVLSNTADTLTMSSAWSPMPDTTTVYQVLRAPDNTTGYQVREGPSNGMGYDILQLVNPAPGTGYQILNLKCHVGGFDLTANFPSDKFAIVTDAGYSSGGNTSTTLNDTAKAWKINQWAGSQVSIVGGPGIGQKRQVVSNTATTMTVSPAWGSPIPTGASAYQVGGISEAGWLGSTGRTVNCPAAAAYTSGSAGLGCITYGALPQGPTGTGSLVNITLRALTGTPHGAWSFTLSPANILEVDATSIPADVLVGKRRVTLCPDSAPKPTPDGVITSGDQGMMAQALGQHTGDPLYTPQKDPDENGVVASADQGILAAVILKRCTQP